MVKTCTVCRDERRPLIDRALVAGEPVRALASRFVPLSRTAIHRHKEEHVPELLARAHEAGEVANADDLLGQVRDLQGKALGILAKAEQAGDLRTALGTIREARGNLELLAKLIGQLDERPVVNLLVAPEYIAVRTRLLVALAPYPEARIAAAEALSAAD